MTKLEREFHLRLQQPWRCVRAEERSVDRGRCVHRRQDGAEGRTRNVTIRLIEVRMVEQVERRDAEVQPGILPFRNRDRLAERQVSIEEARSIHLVPALVAEASCAGSKVAGQSRTRSIVRIRELRT